ncbi:ketopantoate reductase family protein [Desulfosarcina cetonica]|uniref:ketopantoate reductase family protein n=1 Tax=Desulfosarcina cetonica TaxID=90730 RepID=UPI000AEECB00|nr:2-dehydropantoate 2-reductase N-terminal domain-containing protein [Desulfosarcina cetonica]
MKIAMIGAGAMGSLFGALLAEAGETVTLLDIRQDHVDAVNANGLSIESAGRLRSVRVPATSDPDRIGKVDLAFFFVKSVHTAAAAQTAARLTADASLILTLQNGMGNAEALSETIPPARIVAGTTAHGATFLKSGAIRHAGTGETVIGAWQKPAAAGITTIARCSTGPASSPGWWMTFKPCCGPSFSSTSASTPSRR